MATAACLVEPVAPNFSMSDTSGDHAIYCACQAEYCECGSVLGVTEAAALRIYEHLGFPQGRAMLKAEGNRECALHVWGTHNLSTEDVLSWLADYNPGSIEWINDASCNVIFPDPNTVLRVIVDLAEPFDRRVALAAAAALATLLDDKDAGEEDITAHGSTAVEDDSELSGGTKLHLSTEMLDSIEQFSQYLPPTGRWYKALSVPAKTISLFLRFAHKSDVKLPGSERRSLYYRRYGNPNYYSGVSGILNRSNRRRLGLARQKSSDDLEDGMHNVRVFPGEFAEAVAKAYEDMDAIKSPLESTVNSKKAPAKFVFGETKPANPAPVRELIVYDNLYGSVEQPRLSKSSSDIFSRVGTRREAVGFPVPRSPKQPRKWARKDRGPAPDRWVMDDDIEEEEDPFSPQPVDNINVIDLREPWSVASQPRHPLPFSGGASNRRVYQRAADGTTTITLLPDPQSPERPVRQTQEDTDALRTRRLLASMTMVADKEEHLVTKRSLASRLGSHRSGANDGSAVTSSSASRTRNVWQRLG